VPIKPVENQRLYRQIAVQLSELITSGEFPAGGRLPSERDLAVQLGVSRPSVREALIALEIEGKVEVRVGAGIYVAHGRPVVLPDLTREGQGPFELLRARWLIEGETAAEAARHGTSGELARVHDAIVDMQKRLQQGRDLDPADRAFHLAIAKATHNSLLFSVIRELWDQGRGLIWKRMEHHFQTLELRTAVLRGHRAILEALKARDAHKARSAMRHHLDGVIRVFAKGDLARPQSDRATSASEARHGVHQR